MYLFRDMFKKAQVVECHLPKLLVVSCTLGQPENLMLMMIKENANGAQEIIFVNLICRSILSPTESISNRKPLGETRWKEEDEK